MGFNFRNFSLLLVCSILCLTEPACSQFNNSKNDTDVDCRNVHDVPKNKCAFAETTKSCQIDEGFINYVQVVFCSFPDLLPLAASILFLWWLFLFNALAVTADEFFCPALTVMAKILHMSDNIAGVTLLAFGNGAPDIFSAIAAVGSIKNGDAGLAFGALLGAGVFVTCVVAGSVIIAKPFQCMERPLLRDIIFYIAALFYTFCMMYHGEIHTIQAIGFLLLYLAYVLVVVVGRLIRVCRRSADVAAKETLTPNSHLAGVEQDPDMVSTRSKLLLDEAKHEELRDRRVNQVNGYAALHGGSDSQSSEEPGETTFLLSFSSQPNRSFLEAINPISKDAWTEERWFGKIYLVLKAPIKFLLTISCPVVDMETEGHNWNRRLSVLQIVIGPMFIIFAIQQNGVDLGSSFQLWALVLLLCALGGVVCFWFSTDDAPPKWHPAMAFLGFLVAVVWIYSVANEIVNLLQMFGVIFQISDAILGLTLLAWGNSIGDWIADTSLARKGFPRIGISACFGGPLFNLLLGVGIPFTIACLKNDGVFKITFNFEQLVLTGFLALSLVSSLVIIPCILRFNMKRWYGIFLVLLYCCFLLVAVLTETGVIRVKV